MKKLVVIALLQLAVILPTAADTDLTPLLGTWVNPEYNPTEESPKLVYRADGIGETYGTTYAEVPSRVWTYKVEEGWRDTEGSYWYKIVAVKIQTLEDRFWYLLVRVSPDRKTYEEDYIRGDLREFATEINTKSCFYKILYRE
jgi:hypothetical protein